MCPIALFRCIDVARIRIYWIWNEHEIMYRVLCVLCAVCSMVCIYPIKKNIWLEF